MACLSCLPTLAQTEGYDPSNPPDPTVPGGSEQVTRYHLTVSASPYEQGVVSTTGGDYTENARVYLSAYGRNFMTFLYWVDDEGNVLTTSSSFYYYMPARDVSVTAVYKYVPTNPADPEIIPSTKQYNLTLVANPVAGGSFSPNNTIQLREGEQTSIYAYTNSFFRFLRWENENGDTLSLSPSLYYQMPAADTKLIAYYDYVPGNPQNPGKNYFDEFTGEVIVDDFTPGSLSNAVSDAVGGNSQAVTQIVVAGKINSNDFSIANNYSSCTLVDLSRTTGVTTVPSWCYSNNSNLTQIFLPACITEIGYRAFYNATALVALTCHAVTPPSIGSYAFDGVPEGLVVYVPEKSIELYEQAEGWKDFIILPIQANVHSVELNLPDECADGRYKNMGLELVNVKSGQKYKYVVTDRIHYTFNNLIKNTTYNAYLKSPTGIVLAQIDSIKVADTDQSVTFQNIRTIQQVKAAVKLPTGEDVTGQVNLAWYNAEGVLLGKEHVMPAMVEGQEVRLAVALSQQLGLLYVQPQDTPWTVADGENAVTVDLQPLPQLQLQGRVVDLQSKEPIVRATVSVSQTLNSRYDKTFTAKTDGQGRFQLQVFAAPTKVTIAEAEHVSYAMELTDSMLALQEVELEDVALKSITGATINLNFTYTASVKAGEQPETQNFYSDYNNVAYTIYNQTQQKPVALFSVQYPKIVLLEEVNVGDVLQITAASKNGMFRNVVAEATVDEELRVEATLPIVQLGGVVATFGQTENSNVVAILYDADGNLMQKYNYPSAALQIDNLPDGNYTLVTMGQSNFFNAVYKLSGLQEVGLNMGTDYVKNAITVKSGEIVAVHNVVVPFFDESKLYYTGDNTAFTVNKSSIVAGNYLTLQAKVDFKELYRSEVSDVTLVVELPDGCSFVDNSLMVGSSLSVYELENQKLTVQLGESYTDRVRFCVIPTASGTYAPNAYVQFVLNGNVVTQPIGCAQYVVEDLSIKVPQVTSNIQFAVSGMTVGKSQGQVYDGNTLIGEAKALAGGFWIAQCQLDHPYNLSRHAIYAKVTTPNGLEMQSAAQEVEYDMAAVDVKTVHVLNNGTDIELDFLHPAATEKQYTFVPSRNEFTFTVEFTDNDTTKVKNVVVYVKTGNDNWKALPAIFNPTKKYWVANGNFNSYEVPKNVAVDFDLTSEAYYSIGEYEDMYADATDGYEEYRTGRNDLQEQIENLRATIDNDADPETLLQQYAEWEAAFEKLCNQWDLTVQEDSSEDWTDEELEATEQADSLRMMQLLDDVQETVQLFDQYFFVEKFAEYFSPEMGTAVQSKSTEGIEVAYLLENGYRPIMTDTGDTLYIKFTTDTVSVVNYSEDLMQTIILDKLMEATEVAMKVSAGTKSINLNGVMETLKSVLKDVKNCAANVKGILTVLATATEATIEKDFQMLMAKSQELGSDLKDMAQKVTSFVGTVQQELLKPIEKMQSDYKQLQMEYKRALHYAKISTKNLNKHLMWKSIAQRLEEQKAGLEFILKQKWVAGLGRFIGKYAPVAGLCFTAADAAEKIGITVAQASVIFPCPNDKLNAAIAAMYAVGTIKSIGEAVVVSFGVDAALSGGAVLTSETVLGAIGCIFAKMAISWVVDKACNWNFNRRRSNLDNMIASLKCISKDPDDHKDHKGKGSDYPDFRVYIDPAGYVYEAIESNRLQGVMATCYYKETVEDMYGDLHENVVLWDAEEYAQQNPLFTDENGMYRWDVPQGLWQVKFEKEGYQTTYSDWLPVPPPQLEVNIGMVQNAQPEVVKAKAYDEGVEVEFSKYMKPDLLTADNLCLKLITGSEETLVKDATIELLNAEAISEKDATTYASRVALRPTQDLGLVDEVYLIVSNKVESYAGIPMANAYTQKLDVEKKVRSVVVDETLNVGYGQTMQVQVGAVPVDASKGKVLAVKSGSEMIATILAENATQDDQGRLLLTLDENGQTQFTVNGELLGTTGLSLTVLDADVLATSVVNVVDPAKLNAVKEAVASRISGTEVYRGQTVSLSCESEGATIYYTLDGSCPCDAGRMKYDGRPIVINNDMTLKVMAVGLNGSESDVKEYAYTIKQTNLQLSLAEGWNWTSHNKAADMEVSDFEQDYVKRLLTRQAEVINDPVLGFVGNMDAVQASQALKVETSEQASLQLSGEQYNPSAQPIYLQTGWNWLGYPLSQTMSLAEALSYLDAEVGDVLTNLEGGYAEFTADGWTGNLQTMIPGKGYLYKSASEKSFIYNDAIVSRAKALYGHRLELNPAPWTVNVHAYPSMMCLTAILQDGGFEADADDFFVAAFAENEECRGVAQPVGNHYFLSVYGKEEAPIHFVAVHKATGITYSIAEQVSFTPDVVGSVAVPFVFNLGEATGMWQPGVVGGSANGIYNVAGQALREATQPGVYIVNGKKVIINKK